MQLRISGWPQTRTSSVQLFEGPIAIIEVRDDSIGSEVFVEDAEVAQDLVEESLVVLFQTGWQVALCFGLTRIAAQAISKHHAIQIKRVLGSKFNLICGGFEQEAIPDGGVIRVVYLLWLFSSIICLTLCSETFILTAVSRQMLSSGESGLLMGILSLSEM
jgi:hypothetical protein